MLRLLAILSLCFFAGASAVRAQSDTPPLESGTLPRQWRVSGPDCAGDGAKDWQVHRYNADLYILRESGCSNYEKPFLYLIFGEERALLEDTGAGDTEIEKLIDSLVAAWAKEKGRKPVPVIAIHSHNHGDHRSGDARLRTLPNVTVVPAEVEALRAAAHIEDWPTGAGYIELGNRRIDVFPIPGHDAAHIALYDARTGILFTGDTLYPGRLYVRDFPAYVTSIDRLVAFTSTRPVAHILGTHIEQSRTPFTDYKVRTVHQPDETTLELRRGDLLELQQALHEMNGIAKHKALARISIVPVRPR